MMLSRRSLITGLGASLIAAPAIVRAASLMPVRGIVMPFNMTTTEVQTWLTLAQVEVAKAYLDAASLAATILIDHIEQTMIERKWFTLLQSPSRAAPATS